MFDKILQIRQILTTSVITKYGKFDLFIKILNVLKYNYVI